MVISGEIPSSISIGAATGAIAVHFAEEEAIKKSSQADMVVNVGSSSAGGACMARSWSAPTIVVIGPRFRLLSESLRLAKEGGSNATLDGEFGRNLEAVVSSPRDREAARFGTALPGRQ